MLSLEDEQWMRQTTTMPVLMRLERCGYSTRRMLIMSHYSSISDELTRLLELTPTRIIQRHIEALMSIHHTNQIEIEVQKFCRELNAYHSPVSIY